jgi:uncharacterized membrane protein
MSSEVLWLLKCQSQQPLWVVAMAILAPLLFALVEAQLALALALFSLRTTAVNQRAATYQ